jgi:hypothetical protein
MTVTSPIITPGIPMSEHRMYADAFAVKDPKRHAAIDRKKVIRQHV